jgi:hypothetical protein
MVLCENPERMSKDRLGRYVTTLSAPFMGQVAAASILASSAIAFLDFDDLREIWLQARSLNAASVA